RCMRNSLPLFFFVLHQQQPTSTLFPYTTLFRSNTTVSRPGTRSRSATSVAPMLSSYCSFVAPGEITTCSSGKPSEAACCSSRVRSEEHTSELQSLRHLVCRLLLEKKKTYPTKSR